MASKQESTRNVLIVAGSKWAYDCFRRYSAYICQSGRSFRPDVDRIGYYANGSIQCEFPKILGRRDHVVITPRTVQELQSSRDPQDEAFARVVDRLIADERTGGTSQIFLLSGADDPHTMVIPQPIRNTERTSSGRAYAWTRGHRYVREDAILAGPETTSELTVRMSGEKPQSD